MAGLLGGGARPTGGGRQFGIKPMVPNQIPQTMDTGQGMFSQAGQQQARQSFAQPSPLPPPTNVPQMPFQPQGSPQLQQGIGSLQSAGEGFLDPSSDFMTQLTERLRREIGETGEAEERAAVLRASQGGFGAGASPELLDIQSDIGQRTVEAQGNAQADLALQAPGMGAGMLSAAIQPQVQLQGQQQNAFMGQQNLRAQQEAFAAQLQQALIQQQLELAFGGF